MSPLAPTAFAPLAAAAPAQPLVGAVPELPWLPPGAPLASAAPAFYFLQEATARVVRELPPADLSWLEPQRLLATSSKRDLFDVSSVRRDFPILQQRVNGHPLIWLDNAATTQKPQSVIDRLAYFYANENSNIHRAAHTVGGALDRCLRGSA